MHRVNRRHWLKSAAGAAAAISLHAMDRRSLAAESMDGADSVDSVQFLPTWESLAQYRVPDWFRDAKFGIWAHWGPQCAPERGDWYARHMYSQGHPQYEAHVKQYGHPSKFGFKDVIHSWKAEHWDPDALVSLYQRAGARYFFAMANHHDNLDLWDSAHQPWNSVAVGPQRDIVGGWAAAARKHGMRFGVSVHAAHAWLWYESAQGADREGPLAGVPYDGTLTKESGAGTWWEGLDPQQLYAQSHRPSKDFQDLSQIHQRWHWTGDGSTPDAAYCESFRRRTVDLIDKYQPDLLYFDDTGLPLWPISDVGLQIAAHFYNNNMRLHDGRLEALLFGKILDVEQRKCMVWDIERGASNRIEPFPWQTDTCIGGWHYDRGIYDRRGYKSAATVIHMLADIVSKNGNLLLNVPVRGNGTIDEQEREVVEGIAAWMQINGEAIYDTRPWKTFGEGPAIAGAAPLSAQGFNEGRGKAYTAEDVRYTTKGDAIYAILLGVPRDKVVLHALGRQAGERTVVRQIQLVGSNEFVEWQQTDEATLISPPSKFASSHAVAYKMTTASA